MICSNSCTIGAPLVGAGCFGNKATQRLRVKYNLREEEVINLCDRCIIVVAHDARKKGFKVHVIRNPAPERNPIMEDVRVTRIVDGKLYKKVGWAKMLTGARKFAFFSPIWGGTRARIHKESYGYSIWVLAESIGYHGERNPRETIKYLDDCELVYDSDEKVYLFVKPDGTQSKPFDSKEEALDAYQRNPIDMALIGYGFLIGTGFEAANLATKHIFGGARKNPNKRRKK